MTEEVGNKGLVRLEVQVEHLTKEVSSLKELILERKTPGDHRVESNERLVNTELGTIKEALKRLEGKLEERSKPNYGPIIAAVALFWTVSSAIVGFFINSQNATITRIERDIMTIQQSDVPRTELNDKFRDVHRRLDGLEKRPTGSR